MAIRVNTNIASLNAQRQLGSSQHLLNRTLERLSSGLRINRAADDAAGMAVSEKMRTQTRGFTQAIGNSQDAVNLIATAESGLDQTSQILQRMRELSIQSANDTLVNKDRAKIQEELNQLRMELTRIAETTQFNTRNLLDGSIAQATGMEEMTGKIKQSFRIGSTTATIPQLQDFFQVIDRPTAAPMNIFDEGDRIGLFAQDSFLDNHTLTVDIAFQFKIVSYQTTATAPVSVAIEVSNSVSGFLYSLDPQNQATWSETGGVEAQLAGPGLNHIRMQLSLQRPSASAANVFGHRVGIVEINNNSPLTLSDIGKTAVIQLTPRRAAVTLDQALTFHVGANEGQFLKMGVQDMRAAALRMETLNILGTNDESSRLKAQNAIGAIDAALEYVNTNRARLGAFQNRVEYTIQNLQASRENLTAAESRIRDTDVAAETAQLTRAQILLRAGTSVLSQANLTPQSALSLLA